MTTFPISEELYAKLKIRADENKLTVDEYAQILIERGLANLKREEEWKAVTPHL